MSNYIEAPDDSLLSPAEKWLAEHLALRVGADDSYELVLTEPWPGFKLVTDNTKITGQILVNVQLTVPAPAFAHVHNCAASLEERPCEFDWSGHNESPDCACGPTLDETNLPLNGTVFVVHQGVC